MKKISFLFILSVIGLVIYSPKVFSQGGLPVNMETAKAVALKYCLETDTKYAKTSEKELILSLAETKFSGTEVLYYVFNINSNDGFIIISADTNTPPVLCYVPQGIYSKYPELRPAGFNEWLGEYSKQIETSLKNVTKSKQIQDSWSSFLAKGALDVETMVLKLTSKWNQTEYFNGLSPQTGVGGHPAYTPSYGGRAPTGCVATAMGQIMYYYQWPLVGVGEHTYSDPSNPNTNSSCGSDDPTYNSLSFINHNSTYDYSAMVDVPTSTNTEISRLLYNSAISVDMDFAYCQSWTNTSNVENALRSYFNFDTSIDYVKKSDYSPTAWENLIIGEIRKERPVQYRGQSESGAVGHSWVCYGYQTVGGAKEFKFNWGWGGDYDGFFSLTVLNKWPLSDLSTENGAVINIFPTSQPNLALSLGSVSPDPVFTLTQFTVNFTIANSGSRNAVASIGKCYLSADSILDKNDLYISSISLPALAYGQSATMSKIAVMGDVPAGPVYYILIEADSEHDVHESDETDNVLPIKISIEASPVSSGDFRTAASGLWSNPGIWQYFNGTDWVAAGTFPVNTSGKILIRNSHTVTVTNSLTVDEVTILPGGQVTVSPGYTLTIADGPDPDDFIVEGTIVNSGVIVSTGILAFYSGSVYEHAQDGGTIPVATWAVDSDCNITGVINSPPSIPLQTQPFGNFTYNCPGQITDPISLAGQLRNIAGNFVVISTGSGQNDLRLGQSTAGDLIVDGNFIQRGGTFVIIGSAGSPLPRKMTVMEDFLLESGSFAMSYLEGAATLDVGGNFTSYGLFYFAFSSTTPDILNVAGNCSISGGTFEMSRSSAIGTLNIGGNFSHTGSTISETSTGSGAIVFKGSGVQTYTSGGTLNGTINFTVNNGSTLQMGDGSNPSVISSGSIGTFTLAAGATLGITSPQGISADGLTGNIQVAGTRIYNQGANYIYNRVGAQISGNGLPLAVNKLTVSGLSDFSLSGSSLTVSDLLEIGSGATLNIGASKQMTTSNFTNSGTMIIESTAVDNNGSFIASGNLIQGGTVIYNRQLRTKDSFGDYHLISSPVNNQSVPDFKSANIAKLTKIKAWQETNSTWPDITNTTGNLVSGQGYSLTQAAGSDGKFSFTGSIVNSAAITATSPYKTGYTDRSSSAAYGLGNEGADIWAPGRSWTNYGAGGWNLLGNPFTSAMDAGLFISANLTGFDPNYRALYIYDGTSGQYKYAAASVPVFTASGLLGDKIQAGQGFFAIALYDGITFNFTPAMQVHNTSVAMTKSHILGNPWSGLQLNVKDDNSESQTTIVFNDMMTSGLDPGYDVGMFSAGSDPEIYTLLVTGNNGVNFARQALPGYDNIDNGIPVGLNSVAGGVMTFSATTVPVDDHRFYLEDRKTGIFTDLSANKYTVTLPPNTFGTGRFFIYSSMNTPTEVRILQDDKNQLNLQVWASDKKLTIEGAVSSKAFLTLYNLQGYKTLEKKLTEGIFNSLDIPEVAKGVYIVKVTDGPKVVTKKLVVF